MRSVKRPLWLLLPGPTVDIDTKKKKKNSPMNAQLAVLFTRNYANKSKVASAILFHGTSPRRRAATQTCADGLEATDNASLLVS